MISTLLVVNLIFLRLRNITLILTAVTTCTHSVQNTEEGRRRKRKKEEEEGSQWSGPSPTWVFSALHKVGPFTGQMKSKRRRRRRRRRRSRGENKVELLEGKEFQIFLQSFN
jgi:hypothetical protein